MRRIAAAIVVLLGVGADATASPILDQAYQPTGDNGFIVELSQSLAQTFTVGRDGLLTRFEVELARVSDPSPVLGVDWEIRELDAGGLPNGALLASGTIAPLDVPTVFGYVGVDLHSFDIGVTAGDQLAIVLLSLSEPTKPGGGINPYAWHVGGDGYLRGEGFVKHPLMDWGHVGPDAGFKTFVPEPSVLSLLGFAGGIFALRRVRRFATGDRRLGWRRR